MKNKTLSMVLLSAAALFNFVAAVLHFLQNGFTDYLGWVWLVVGIIFCALTIRYIRKQGS